MNHSFSELIALAKQGDNDAITELYNLSNSAVYKSIRAMIQDEDAAMDVMQDSYIKAFQSLEDIHEPEKFISWMKKIAINHARNYLVKRHDIPMSRIVNEDGEEVEFEDEDLSHLPEFAMDRKVTAELVDKILGTLSDEQREVIVMRYYQGMSEQEIAQIQGCSVNTVKSRTLYAKKKIEKAVLELEKKEGIKLHSMAPLPFLLWLLRAAKAQGIPVDTVSKASTLGAAAATGKTATDAATGQAAGKAADSAGKAVAQKVIAGTLAVTVAGGAGAAAVHTINANKRAEAAHTAYVDFLDHYQDTFQMDAQSFRLEYDGFWEETTEEILQENPNADKSVTQSWYLSYDGGDTFQNGMTLPATAYTPSMNSLWLLESKIPEESFRYAYLDTDGDGIDELFVAKFYRGALLTDHVDVYTFQNEALHRGQVQVKSSGETQLWTLEPSQEAEYVTRSGYSNIVYINMGAGFFDRGLTLTDPQLPWQTFFEKK